MIATLCCILFCLQSCLNNVLKFLFNLAIMNMYHINKHTLITSQTNKKVKVVTLLKSFTTSLLISNMPVMNFPAKIRHNTTL